LVTLPNTHPGNIGCSKFWGTPYKLKGLGMLPVIQDGQSHISGFESRELLLMTRSPSGEVSMLDEAEVRLRDHLPV
jgi:L-asparaginase II